MFCPLTHVLSDFTRQTNKLSQGRKKATEQTEKGVEHAMGERVIQMAQALIFVMRTSDNNAVINEAYRLYQELTERSKGSD